MWLFTRNEPETKQEHEHKYVSPVVTEVYDDEGYKLIPGIFGGYVREVDLKPVEEYRPSLFPA